MSTSQGIDDATFGENLRRYFDAGDPTSYLAAWRRLERDDRALAELDRRLADAELAVAGLAWWEERAEPPVIGPVDRVNLWLSTEPTLAPRPVPRAHRPPWLVGSWRWVGWAADGSEYEPLAPGQRWHLRADGSIDVTGDDPHGVRNASWRVHRANPFELWIDRPGDVHPKKWALWRRDAAIELRPPGSTRARGRLERSDPAGG